MSSSPILIIGNGITSSNQLPTSTITKLDHVLKLTTPETHVILSGKYSYQIDRIPPITEAQLMAEYLTQQGISTSRLHLEADSYSTVENFYFTKTNILIPQRWFDLHIFTFTFNLARIKLNADYILGPDYTVTFHSIPDPWPPEKLQILAQHEPAKLAKATAFLSKFTPGDHTAIITAARHDIQSQIVSSSRT